MHFEYTYTGRLLKEIADRENEIKNLRTEVYNLIGGNDATTTRNKYNELCDKWDNFADFKKDKENHIKECFYKNFKKISNKYKELVYDDIKRRNIKKDKGNHIYLKLDKLPKDIQNDNYSDITIFGENVFSHIFSTPHCTKEEANFVIEFYDFTNTPLSYLYEKETFNDLQEDIKIRCFQDTLKEVYGGLRESLINNKINASYYIVLTDMLKDGDIIDFVNKEYGSEKTNLKNIARILQNHFPASDEILEEISNTPKAIKEFIDVVENVDNNSMDEKDIEK